MPVPARSSDLTEVDVGQSGQVTLTLAKRLYGCTIATHDPGDLSSGFPWPSGGIAPFYSPGAIGGTLF